MKTKSLLLFMLMALLAPLALNAQSALPVNEGEATNSYVPVYGFYADAYLRCQYVQPAGDLNAITGGTINGLTFYLSTPASEAWTGTFQVYVTEVDDATISAFIDPATATVVYEGTLDATGSTMEVAFDTPYSYGGGNLLIGFDEIVTGNYKSASFTGVEATGASIQGYSYTSPSAVSPAQRNFLPMMDIAYTDGSGVVCDRPETLEVSNVTGSGATLAWTGGSGTYNVEYKLASATDWTALLTNTTVKTYTLSGLDSNTAYNVRVQSVCTDATSGWKSANFTTPEICPDGKICIGEGTTTSPYLPANNYYRYSLSQQIYTADEIGEAGAILSIDFFKAATTAMVKDLDIYMVLTEKVEFDSITDFIPVTASNLVYSGTVTFADNDWTTIELDAPFIYDGTSNVAIMVDNNTGGYVSNTPFYVFNSDKNQALYAQNDGTNFDPFAPSFSYRTAQKNRIRLVVGEPPACPKPTALTVDYQGGKTATVTWEGEALTYNIDVNGNVITDATSPYTLDLELATTYAVKVQANCDDATSDWAGPVSFTTDACMPEDMTIVNYALTDSYGDGWNGNYILVVDENCNIVNQLTIESGNSATGTLRVCGSYVQFLWYAGDYPGETSWVFTDNAGNVLFEGTGTADMATLDVLYTIDNNPYSAPTDVTASEVGPRSAKLSWTETGTATAWQILLTAGDDEEGTIIDANSNPFVITGLTPETEYFAQVRATGANGTSIWTCLGADFTTTEPCPAPANLTATRVTATSATLNWEGFADTYNVSYAPVVHGEVIESNNFDDSSMGGWTTIDADADGYDWVLGSACGGVYLAEGSSLAGTGHESSADLVVSGSYSNVTGVGALNPDNYLVSPQVALGGSINFWACGQDASYAAEHFGVAVSTTGNTDASDFTTIWSTTLTAKGGNDRGGNATMIVKGGAKANPGTTRSGNRDQGNWYQFTIDLSDYSGQGYVAIRHFGCTDQFMLDVDDIVIEGPATTDVQWIDLTGVNENSIDIDGLEAETEYMWKVQANCGAEDGTSLWSNSTFTTGNFCETPHELEATNITYNAATLNWTGSQESYNLQYRTAEVTEEYYFYDFNAGYDAAQEAGWNWEGIIIYGFDDPIYNIPGDDNYFLQMGWATTNETYIFSPELPEYESGSLLEFYYFGYSTANTFQVGYSTTTNDTLSFSWGKPIDAPLQTYTKFSEELPAGTKYVAFKTTASEQSAAIFIDNFHIYKVMAAPGEWVTVENVTEPYELTGLTPEAEYEWQVQGVNASCGELEWSEIQNFTTPEITTLTQTITLEEASTWFSTYVDITLDDLKAALVAALPANTTIKIKNADEILTYSRGRWNGSLTWDVAKMYKIIVPTTVTLPIEFTLEGMPLDPSEHTITIAGSGRATWIGFPFSENMTPTNAFAVIAQNGDKVKSSSGNTSYTRGRWQGEFPLEPGKGYIFISNANATDRTLVYPTSSKAVKK